MVQTNGISIYLTRPTHIPTAMDTNNTLQNIDITSIGHDSGFGTSGRNHLAKSGQTWFEAVVEGLVAEGVPGKQ